MISTANNNSRILGYIGLVRIGGQNLRLEYKVRFRNQVKAIVNQSYILGGYTGKMNLPAEVGKFSESLGIFSLILPHHRILPNSLIWFL